MSYGSDMSYKRSMSYWSRKRSMSYWSCNRSYKWSGKRGCLEEDSRVSLSFSFSFTLVEAGHSMISPN